MISAEVGPPSSIVAAWITQRLGMSPGGGLDRLAEVGSARARRSRPGRPARRRARSPPRRPPPCLSWVLAAFAIASTSSLVTSAWRTSIGSATRAIVSDRAGGEGGRSRLSDDVDETVRARHLDELAAELRARLIEQRRAEAARRRSREPLAACGRCARAGRGGRRAAGGAGQVEARGADPARGGRPRPARGAARRPRGGGGHGQRARSRLRRACAVGSSETEVSYASEQALRDAIERILAPLGRRVDELSPMVDARLEDGSRVNVVVPPLAVDGPSLSIRRFGAARPGPDELVELGTLTAGAARPARGRGGRAAQHPGQRRHGLGQDHPAQRALGLHRPGGARDHDRGRGRAAAAPAARRPPREPAGQRRGTRAGSRSATCCETRCGCAPTGS